jgi:hypothetical protein
LLGSHAPRWRGAHTRGRRGRPSHPLIRLSLIRGCGFSKGPHPLLTRCPTGGATIFLPLFTRPRGPIRAMAHCPHWGVCRDINTSRVATAILETLQNITTAVKRKNCKSGRSRASGADPNAGDPSSQGVRASTRRGNSGEVHDLVNLGFHLCLAQLLGGRTVGAGGPPIHPHLGLPQLMWLNPVVEEHP